MGCNCSQLNTYFVQAVVMKCDQNNYEKNNYIVSTFI